MFYVALSSLRYLCICMFVYLFINLFCRTTGLYTKTLARIVYRDISRFTCVFLVVFLAFCGAFFLSLRAASAVQVFGLSVLVYRVFLCLYKSWWKEMRFTLYLYVRKKHQNSAQRIFDFY